MHTYATNEQGKESVLGSAWEGGWCGDTPSAYAGWLATVTIQALEDIEVLHLSIE